MSRRTKPQTRLLPELTVMRPTPEPPSGLGEAGLDAWKFIWLHSWIIPERHRLLVVRYCRTQDLLNLAYAELERAGLMQLGSHKQLRAHPVMCEIRALSVECRLMEIEMGLTPASEAKAGVPQQLPRNTLDDQIAARRKLLGGDDECDRDDPRRGLRPVN